MSRIQQSFQSGRVRAAAGVVMVLIIGASVWAFFPHIHRKPPSIFDTPVDGVLDYLSTEDFSKLSVKERMEYLSGIVERFKGFSQFESVIASSFFAGLTGPANEKLIDNARLLGKDILVEGAAEFLALKTQDERDKFIDKWIVDWVRFGEKTVGRDSGKSDEEVLNQMSRQAKRDSRQVGDLNDQMAQRIMDFWDRDVASVSSPKEQSQIFQFAPAIRQRLLTRAP